MRQPVQDWKASVSELPEIWVPATLLLLCSWLWSLWPKWPFQLHPHSSHPIKRETEKEETSLKYISWESQMALTSWWSDQHMRPYLPTTEVSKFHLLPWMQCAQVNTGVANSKEVKWLSEQIALIVTLC